MYNEKIIHEYKRSFHPLIKIYITVNTDSNNKCLNSVPYYP